MSQSLGGKRQVVGEARMAEPFHCERCGWVSTLPGRTECPYCIGIKCRDCQQPRPCPCDATRERLAAAEKPWSEAAETTAGWETEALTCHGCGLAETSATECHVCGSSIDPESAECVRCGWTSRLALQAIEGRELAAEERRPGVIDTEESPPWQRRVMVLLDECFPIVVEALHRSQNRFVNSMLTDLLCLLRDTQLEAEDPTGVYPGMELAE